MKKMVWLLGGLLLLGLVMPVAAIPAVVMTDVGCSIHLAIGDVTGSSVQVFTTNENEIGMISCKGVLSNPPRSLKKAVTDREVSCIYENPEIGTFYTDKGILVITPSGQVSIMCNFVPPITPPPS